MSDASEQHAAPTEQKTHGGLAQRAVTGVILAVVVLAIIWLPATVRLPAVDHLIPSVMTFESMHLTVHRHPKFFFGLLAVVFVMIGFREYAAMTLKRDVVLEKIGGTLAVGFVVLISCMGNLVWTNFAFFAAVAVLAWVHILRGMAHHTLPGLASTVFGVLYLGWLPAHLVMLYMTPKIGPGLVTTVIAITAMSDSGAYFVGRTIGKHKMAPHTSPKKTWEGAAGGLVASVLTGAFIFTLNHHFHIDDIPAYPIAWYLFAGVLLSFVSQIGDLIESMLKRDAGVKDSGTIFPGHGGVLDRCDGILFACPAMYYLLMLDKGL